MSGNQSTANGDGTGNMPPNGDLNQPIPHNLSDLARAAAASNARKRNWTRVIHQGLRDIQYVLGLDSHILHVSANSANVLGFPAAQLVNEKLSSHVHDDDAAMFARELWESTLNGRNFRFFMRLRQNQEAAVAAAAAAVNRYGIFEATGHFEVPRTCTTVSSFDSPGIFFLVARPYPTSQGCLLDAFLGLQMENLALLQQIATLRAEEGEIQTHQQQQEQQSRDQSAVGAESSPLLTSDRHSASSGSPVPRVVDGDVGIPFIVKPSSSASSGKKRAKDAEEYVCEWCNTTNAPEWRKGPKGPKTLCNACGLRWAKARKKAGEPPEGPLGPPGPAAGPDAGAGAGAAAGAGVRVAAA